MTTNNGSANETATAETNTNGALPDGVGSNGHVRAVNINTEMQTAYLDYAMSVIVSRALPDVRDGLKPVHRRILYAMYRDLGLTADKPYKKSARIVGEVLGKYHPHGDTAVYDAMVRMAQEFSLRYPLVDGQGNFGSVDGDNAAAMRYTEARLAAISNLMLDDLEKDTVDWHDNFDNSLLEPDILPAALPNLLINGASGIAVGMATNIPPHNLGEVVDALTYMIDHYHQVDAITVEQLTRFIQGPDFPTGGILYRYRESKQDEEDTDAIAQGYAVGRARLILQAKAHFEEMSRNRKRIVITELPYQTNKTTLIERIASLVRNGKVEGITDLRDESDRAGMRIVIELTRNVDPKRILERLFKYTPLQQTFGMRMLALVDGEPQTLSLKRLLHHFIQHREVIIRRRSEFDLNRAKARAHIVEGLLKALDILDDVIATIRRSQRVDTARNNLMKNFGFTQVQAQAILDMQLRRLAALERRKLQDEFKELRERIDYLEDLLAHPEKILAVIREDLVAIKEEYGDARRTQIVERTKGTLTSTDLLPDQDVWVSVSAKGHLSRVDVTKKSATTARQAGKGAEVALLAANARDQLYLFSRTGQCRRVSIHEIPQGGRGKHLSELTEFSKRDDITAAIALPRDLPAAEGYLCLVTEQGVTKRIALADFMAAAATEPVVMNVESGDGLAWVLPTRGEQDVVLVSSAGQSIRFSEEDVRSMGLAAGGVGGIKLKKGQRVVHAAVVDPAGELLTVTANGYAKRTPLTEYSTQGRNGRGIVTHKPSARTGDVAAALVLPAEMVQQTEDELVIVLPTKGAVQPVSLSQIPQMGRSVQGKQIVAIGMGAEVAALQRLTLPARPTPPGGDDESSDANPSTSASNASNGKVETETTSKTTARARSKTQTKTRTKKKQRKQNSGAATGAAPPGDTRSKTSRNAKSGQKATTRKKTTKKSTKKSTAKSTNAASKNKSAQKKSASTTTKKSTRRTVKAQASSAQSPGKPAASQSTASQSTASQSTASQSTGGSAQSTRSKAAKSKTNSTTSKSQKSAAQSTAKKPSSKRTPTRTSRKKSTAQQAETASDKAASNKSAPQKSTAKPTSAQKSSAKQSGTAKSASQKKTARTKSQPRKVAAATSVPANQAEKAKKTGKRKAA